MRYDVRVKKRAKKDIGKMPAYIQKKFAYLLLDLERCGPVIPDWPHFSKLGSETYHCHLSEKWVACWQSQSGTLLVEVYYAGSREGAPY